MLACGLGISSGFRIDLSWNSKTPDQIGCLSFVTYEEVKLIKIEYYTFRTSDSFILDSSPFEDSLAFAEPQYSSSARPYASAAVVSVVIGV